MKSAGPEILRESDEFIVVLKPAGVSVIPERPGMPEFSLQPGRPAASSAETPPAPLTETLGPRYGKLYVVHRIDKETSGIVLMARTKAAHAALSLAFQERRVEKVYRAIVSGRPEWERTTCELMLRADGDRMHRTIVDPRRGKKTKTVLSRLSSFGSYSLIEARPETGRTHQIRVHLSALGHPILCDPLYGSGKPVFLSDFKKGRRGDPFDERPLMSRLALHALLLSLESGGERLSFEAPYPRDFQALLSQLEKAFGGEAR